MPEKLYARPLLAVACIAIHTASAGAAEMSADLTLTTDYVFRGVSQTMSGPALQGGLTIEHESGLFVYAWGSNVDYVPDGAPDDDATIEIDILLGYSHAMSERVTVTASWVRYAFPGMLEEIRYDFSEWTGALTVDDRHRLTIAYSPDVFGSGGSSTYFSAATVFELPARLELGLELGRYDLQNSYAESYTHAAVSLAGGFGLFDWTLAYHRTSDAAAKIFHESTVAPEIVLSLSLAF